MTKRSYAHMERIREAFQKFDSDGNGRIERSEFYDLLEALEDILPARATKGEFEVIDIDGDGRISFAEFATWWTDQVRKSTA